MFSVLTATSGQTNAIKTSVFSEMFHCVTELKNNIMSAFETLKKKHLNDTKPLSLLWPVFVIFTDSFTVTIRASRTDPHFSIESVGLLQSTNTMRRVKQY